MMNRLPSKRTYITRPMIVGEMGSEPGVSTMAVTVMKRIARAPPTREEGVAEDPDPRQDDEHDRELEQEPEGEQRGRDKADVLVDREERRGDVGRRHPDEELEHVREDEVAEPDPQHEEEQRRDEPGPDEAPLSASQPRRDEPIRLVQQDGIAIARPVKAADLQLGAKRAGRRREVEGPIGGGQEVDEEAQDARLRRRSRRPRRRG